MTAKEKNSILRYIWTFFGSETEGILKNHIYIYTYKIYIVYLAPKMLTSLLVKLLINKQWAIAANSNPPRQAPHIDIYMQLIWMNSQIFLPGRVVSDWYY